MTQKKRTTEEGTKRVAEEGTAMDRRSFLKTLAVGTAGAAGVGMLSACSPNAGDGTNGTNDEIAGGGATTADQRGYYSWLGEPPAIDDSQIASTVEVDVVVMGGGNAGVMCACAAVEEGLTVAVIEAQGKDDIYYYGLHDIANINSQVVLSHGVEEIKKSEFLAEFQKRTLGKTNPRIVKKFIDNSGPMVDWLYERMPQEVKDTLKVYDWADRADYWAVGGVINGFRCWPGYININFQLTAPALIEEAEGKGAAWYWNHTGIVLVTEEGTFTDNQEFTEDGIEVFKDVEMPQTRVLGLVAQDPDGNYIKFLAKKGVALTGGDYGGNPEMYYAIQDEQRWLFEAHGKDTSNMTCSGFGRDGSGIKMGMWAGGSLDPNTRAMVWPQVMFSSDRFATNLLSWAGQPFMIMDHEGKRFCNEVTLGAYALLSQVERRKPGLRYYTVFDSKYAKNFSLNPPEHFAFSFTGPSSGQGGASEEDILAKWLAAGAAGYNASQDTSNNLEGPSGIPEEATPTSGVEATCSWGANSLDELLDYMGMDATTKATALAEIDTWNRYCEQGEDEDFGRDPNFLVSITDPPFYGFFRIDETPELGTVCLNGLNTDDYQRVLDKNYNPIVGLYASGNNSGGRFAIQYTTPMSGLTLGMALTLGRVLGQQIAQGEI
ncbi:MAG: FAD-binding protein [Coriobacteriales bacterium]|nr:FAD-binding protein [Coriobacteriales bacterium]